MADDSVPFKRSSALANASDLPYTPAVLTDWDGNADPGNVKQALDQLAERIDDAESAGGIAYTPAVGGNWVNPDPTLVSGALDDLAGRVTTLEAGVPASEVTYTPADTNDWPGADPTLVSGALDTAADRIALLEAAALKGRLLTVTVGAEAANVIPVTIDVDDLLGTDIAGATRIAVKLFTDALLSSGANTAAFTLTDAGDGSIEATDAGVVSIIALTGGSSRVQLSATDVATASGTTLYGTAEVLASTPVFSAVARFSLSFDGV